MNKKTLNRIINILVIVCIVAVTIAGSYFGSILFTSTDFKVEVLFEFIGCIALDIALVGVSFKLYMNIIGGKK